MNKYKICEYIEIINLLETQYNSFTCNWNKDNSLNMNSQTIYNIYNKDTNYIEDDFYNLLKKYYDDCSVFIVNQKINFKSITDKNIRSRLKETDSLIEKIHKKMSHDNGKFPINKVVNDIIGYRIIDDNFESENEEKLFEILKNDNKRIRILNRNLKGYKAMHIYFRGQNNYCFPIELQIWDGKYKDENLKSHIIHKQGYIDNIERFDKLKIKKGEFTDEI